MANAAPSTRAIVCDLGGVLLGIDFTRAIDAWAPLSELSRLELQAAFAFDLPYEQHERGEIDGEAYFSHLRAALRLNATHAEIAAGWNAIFLGEVQESLEHLVRARQRVPIYLFSNSNATHKAVWSARYPRLISAFDAVFVSSDLGYRKPEPEAFRAVARRIGVPLEAILFLDDTLENVDGAIAVGMRAVHVRSPADVAAALEDIDRAG